MEMCTPPSHDEIVHISSLSDDIKALYLNDDYSDVTLNVDGESFKAHKVILAARSEYFRALLFGGLRESTQAEISLCVSNVVAFKALLKYIYTGRLSLASLMEDVTLDILGLAHQYGFQNLEKSICDFFIGSLSTKNVFSVYNAARLYQLKNLSETCKTYIDQNIPSNLASHINKFVQLSPVNTFKQGKNEFSPFLTENEPGVSSSLEVLLGLKEIIERHSFYAPELEIFKVVEAWSNVNNMKGTSQLNDVLNAVRFELMSLEELCTSVRPSGLVPSETILDALEQQTSLRNSGLRYRGTLNVNVNMADPCLGTKVIQGEMKSTLLDGNTMNYDMENGYTRHTISDSSDGILIKLGSHCIVNHIKLLLWDKDLRSYSYYIEVSIDRQDWVTVVDHRKYYCRSWQKLYFEPRVVNYIRIVGTYNTVNPVFHLVTFEVMYSTDNFNLVDGIIRPVYHNVATTKESASVIEGVCRSRNSLLDGNLIYDWNNGYTCHQIGSGAILVQLGQPYMIDSMSLLLWDRDDRSYRYYVEVSVDKKHWEIVWDKKDEDCRSWQLIVFPMRPVVFIKIIGTYNTANEVFHLVHIECPSMMCTKENVKKEKSNDEQPKGILALEDTQA